MPDGLLPPAVTDEWAVACSRGGPGRHGSVPDAFPFPRAGSSSGAFVTLVARLGESGEASRAPPRPPPKTRVAPAKAALGPRFTALSSDGSWEMTEKVSHDPVNLPRLGGTARRETFFSFFEGRASYSRGVHWLRSTRDGLSWTASEAQYDRRGYVGAPAVDGRVAVTCDRLGAGQDIARKAGGGRCRRSVENAKLWTGIEIWPSDCSSVPWRRPYPRPLSPDPRASGRRRQCSASRSRSRPVRTLRLLPARSSFVSPVETPARLLPLFYIRDGHLAPLP